ncbi:MAG: HD domain-containing protein [Thermoguttaceae bacterium]
MISSTLIVLLSEMEVGEEADAFALLTEKELIHAKSGKSFYKTVFRDSNREIPTVPIWPDSALFEDCQKNWTPGNFYKIRAILRSTPQYGLQLEVRRIREVTEQDKQDGFDPSLCRPSSKFEPDAMYDEILAIAKLNVGKGKLLNLITRIFKENRQAILETAAARHHHHAFAGGLLEHTLSVTKIAVALADHFLASYSKMPVPFSKPLVVSGAILHDIGKIQELRTDAVTSHHTIQGDLIGHSILGRDIVRDNAKVIELDPKTLLHLEHIIISHQRFADWGAAKPPMSLEAMLVHHADSCDAFFGSYLNVMKQDDTPGEITSPKNMLGYALFRGK